MNYILAIDQGTTGSRAIVYDSHGIVKASCYKEFSQYYPTPGWVEHDPEEIWRSVLVCIQKVLTIINPSSIAAIGIANQRETTILWDSVTGKPLYNAIVWQCRRTSPRCHEIRGNRALSRMITQRTGLPVDAYFSATKIEWILKNVPSAFTKAKAGNALFGTPDSWILWKLTGGASHSTDHTNASRTMIYNIAKLQWDEELLKFFKIPRSILPVVRRSSYNFGSTVKIGKLPSGIPISGIAGDQQASLFGQACFSQGYVKNTYGTGSFVLMNTGKNRPVSKNGLITTLACGPKAEPVYALEGAVFIAGAAMQWLRDGLKILKNAKDSSSIAGSLTNNAGVYFVPAFVGLGAPYWDPDARGGIFGLTRATTGAHIIRAGLEAICYQTKDVLLAMQKDCGMKIKNLKVDGGAAANNFLLQFQADILGIEVIRSKAIETTSLGAAYLAGLRIGYWKHSGQIKDRLKQDITFKPRMSSKVSRKLYQAWREAIDRTRS